MDTEKALEKLDEFADRHAGSAAEDLLTLGILFTCLVFAASTLHLFVIPAVVFWKIIAFNLALVTVFLALDN